MKRRISVLFLICLLLLTGCSNKDIIKHKYSFKGESDLWEVYYQEKSVYVFTEKDGKLTYESNTEALFTAVYKHELSDLENVKQLVVGYKAGFTESTHTMNYDSSGPDRLTFVLQSNSGLGSYEDGEVTATLTIDGASETIKLERK